MLRTRLHQASASTLQQLCDDASDSVLIENNGAASEWGCSIVAVLTLTLSVNKPYDVDYDVEGVNPGKFQEVFKFRVPHASRSGSATSAIIHHGLSIEKLISIPLNPGLPEVNIIL